MEQHHVILWCGFVSVMASMGDQGCNVAGETYCNLMGYECMDILKETSDVSLLDCALLCHQMSVCQLFSYNHLEVSCHLHANCLADLLEEDPSRVLYATQFCHGQGKGILSFSHSSLLTERVWFM